MNRTQRIFPPALVALFCTITALMVSACGFQLRGTVNIASDLQNLSVQAGDHNFKRTLTRSLEQTGITVTDNAPYRIHVLGLDRKELVASSSGGSIVTDYELTATLTWQLEDETGLVLIPESRLIQQGSYQSRPNQYNAANREQGELWSTLLQTLSTNLTRRLAALTNAQLQQMADQAAAEKSQ